MKEATFSACKFSVDIVPYMYGELAASESSAFESHLLDCNECTDEFAMISNARYEVYDWKKLAFDPLTTPEFAIPFEAEPASSVGASWIEKLRTVFASGWAIPGVAFAGVAVVFVLGAVLLISGDKTDVARNDNKTNVPFVGPADAPQPTKNAETATAAQPETEDVRDRSVPAPVRIASPGKGEQKQVVRDLKVIKTRANENRRSSTRAQNAPRLNDFTEDEDTSLRLAELFNDIESD